MANQNQFWEEACLSISFNIPKKCIQIEEATFCLAILAQERRITNDSIKRPFQPSRKLNGLFEIIFDEFFEHGETLIVFEEFDSRFAFVVS